MGQIYLMDNPLLQRSLVREDIKPRLLGHWGTTPGLNLLWTHLNRLIRERDVDAIFLAGPGHGGPAAVANAWLEGTYSEVYPHVGDDARGMQELFRQFSFPGGIPSHVAPETPGSIHEGGELGYVLSHAYGAAMDNPDLVVAAVVGDGEFETGPLAASWHANKFVDPVHDGAVLPVLHLNGYKIANPTIPARIPREELLDLLRGYGHEVWTVEGDDPALVHRQLATALDQAHDRIVEIQRAAREDGDLERRPWPMILLVTPKGWTGPDVVDGVQVEGTWRAHQVPLANTREDDEHRSLLESWLTSYGPGELFDDSGRLVPELRALAPRGERRMSANPHANGGLCVTPSTCRTSAPAPWTCRHRAPPCTRRRASSGATWSTSCGTTPTTSASSAPTRPPPTAWTRSTRSPTRSSPARSWRSTSTWRAVGASWRSSRSTRARGGSRDISSPAGTGSSAATRPSSTSSTRWSTSTRSGSRPPVRSGGARPSRRSTTCSPRTCGVRTTTGSPTRTRVIDHVVNKSAEVVRVYLPPDTNTLLSTMRHCLESTHYVNVVVAGKQPTFDWLDAEAADLHCARGLGIWDRASTTEGDPDVVIACAGDVPTIEALAATSILREHLPELAVRFVNVVDLMRLQDDTEHPHGLSARDFDTVFTTDRPVIFAYHGYPWLIHRLTYRRSNHQNIHVRGYKEEGTTTSPSTW